MDEFGNINPTYDFSLTGVNMSPSLNSVINVTQSGSNVKISLTCAKVGSMSLLANFPIRLKSQGLQMNMQLNVLQGDPSAAKSLA